ncbi:MAG: transposase family protein [Methylocella sp.]
MDGFRECFSKVADPRSGNARRHDLQELPLIALCAVLCGGGSCVEIADSAGEKEQFLREFLSLDNGLPPHDTPTAKETAYYLLSISVSAERPGNGQYKLAVLRHMALNILNSQKFKI